MIEKSENGFYIGDINNPDAQISFIETEVININHTYVSESLRGHGIALQLLEKVVEYAKEKNKKILPTCSYAISKLKDEKYRDIIVK
jgi:predicted GNAT family acetyltransferase